MYFTIFLLLSVCWLHARSQPTRSNDYNDQCGDLSSEMRTLMMELQNLKDQINIIKQYALPNDCSDIKMVNPASASGIYTIRQSGVLSLQVYCDMTTDGGGWLVFQRRQDGTEDFYRNWEDYRHGFGKLDGEFWLGNDALAAITNQRSYELRVDLTDYQGVKAHARYSLFSVDGRDDYRLTLGEYYSNGTAGDSLTIHNDQRYTTFDSDNDNNDDHNCADRWQGAWWYNSCHQSNLNGLYGEGSGWQYVTWRAFRGSSSLKFTEMKIRPTS